MPEGSKWRGYDHKRQVDIGEMNVLHHRRTGLEVYLASVQKVMTFPYPPNDGWYLDKDHVRLAGPDGNLRLSFGPA